jgi:hypothetical protein
MAQAPNRKGNISKTVTGKGGVTAVTRTQGSTAYAAGHVGAPKATGNIASRNQKVMVNTHADYCGCIKNDGYLKSSFYTK